MIVTTRNELIDLLKELNLFHLPCAEIGVARGGFSVKLLESGISKQYLVDNWGHIEGVTGDGNFEQEWHEDNFRIAMDAIHPHKERAVVLRGLSVNMAKSVPENSLGMVYLDGAHYYDAVAKDLAAWFPKLVSGGIMAGHDYLSPAYGVKEAVEDFCRNKYPVHVIPEKHFSNAGFWFIKK